MIQDFFGNQGTRSTLEQMIREHRIPQTVLLSGPEGVGKATLVRRFAAALLGGADKIEADDLSRESNAAVIVEREKWPSDKRSDEPLFFHTHPDFVTFPPDGPLRQISIQQMRLLKERAQFKPLHGSYRVFLIDRIDRANEQAANSLLKTLEEPPEHLVLMLTAENAYDLLPTIRSRAIQFHMSRLSPEEMQSFSRARGLEDPERRAALAQGSPGVAVSLDLPLYAKRREAMLVLLETACGLKPFSGWVKYSESIGASKSEKLDAYLKVLYGLLEDILHLQHGKEGLRNIDLKTELHSVSRQVSFAWLDKALRLADEMGIQLRRNIQKSMALDAMIVDLRAAGAER